MDLEKQLLPACVTVGGVAYKVKTDFRYGLMFTRFVRERQAASEYAAFFDGETPQLGKEALDALASFYAASPTLPRSMGDDGEPLVDWKQDAELIFAAFWEAYGIDLFAMRLHWHKFLALFRSLHDTKLNDVIGYRAWKAGDKTKHEAVMRRLKAAWRLEVEDVQEEDEGYQKFMAGLKPEAKEGGNGRRQRNH